MLANQGVLIVDRNEIAREAFRRVLAERGFASLHTASAADLTAMRRAGLVVITSIDVDEAISHCRTVRTACRRVHIVVVVEDSCSDIVVGALAAGADGVVSRLASMDCMAAMIRLVSLGEKVVPTCVVEELPFRIRHAHVGAGEGRRLSVREMAVLERIAVGRANKLISRDLGIAEGTVKVHVKAILRKLGVSNRTQAALMASSLVPVGQAPLVQ